MNQTQVALLWAVQVGILATLAGLTARRRVHLCWSFVAYLTAVLVSDLCLLMDPARFWKAWFYIWKEAVLDILKLCLAAEIAWRVFRAFPGAWARARLAFAPLVVVTTLAMVSLPTGTTLHDLVFGYKPRISTGTIWLLASTTLLAAWFRLPIHALHRSILAALTAFLGLSTALLEVIRTYGLYSVSTSQALAILGYVNAGAYTAMLCYIAVAAWRPAEAAARAASPALLSRLRLDPA